MENEYLTWLGSPINRANCAAKFSRPGTGNVLGQACMAQMLYSIPTRACLVTLCAEAQPRAIEIRLNAGMEPKKLLSFSLSVYSRRCLA